MTKVSVIGMGSMGARMANVLLNAGHEVAVWNRTVARGAALAEAGARHSADIASALEGAQIAISMLRDEAASRAVWLRDGGLDALDRGALLIECATVSPAWIAALEAAAEARGTRLLEAPVLGSRPQAEAAALIFLLGGDEGDLAEAAPLFADMGGAQHHCGPLGRAAALKLAANALFTVQVATLGELLGYLTRSGYDVEQAVAVLGALPVTSPAAKAAVAGIQARAFAPQFPIELVEKDLACIEGAAKHLQADVPIAQAALAVYREAMTAGRSKQNITAVAAAYF